MPRKSHTHECDECRDAWRCDAEECGGRRLMRCPMHDGGEVPAWYERQREREQ